jgi:bifunctional DNA-binding transcriptional regulator/antitoxin component of YhaV-PrlF toxin-antitoxin module
METTKLSTKGQAILPAAIRAANQWEDGIEFFVDSALAGVC